LAEETGLPPVSLMLIAPSESADAQRMIGVERLLAYLCRLPDLAGFFARLEIDPDVVRAEAMRKSTDRAGGTEPADNP
jgi:hypothetical protein